jgi:flagellar basal body-associated protein FliL
LSNKNGDKLMWKILVAFVIFSAVALMAVFSMGDKASLQGEAGGHTEEKTEAPAVAAPPAAPAAADAPASSASSEAEKK